MKKYGLILLSIFVFNSCYNYRVVPKHLRENTYTQRFDNQNTGLGERLDINGYYTVNDTLNSGYIYHGYTNLMFFEDGMFVSGFYYLEGVENHDTGEVIPAYINKVATHRENGERLWYFYDHNFWGHYTLHGDTIKVQHIYKPAFGEMNGVWYSYEIWFKIIDRQHIEAIYTTPLHKDSPEILAHETTRPDLKLYFRSLPKLPKSDGWLKYEKWFWEDENEFIKWEEMQ